MSEIEQGVRIRRNGQKTRAKATFVSYSSLYFIKVLRIVDPVGSQDFSRLSDLCSFSTGYIRLVGHCGKRLK